MTKLDMGCRFGGALAVGLTLAVSAVADTELVITNAEMAGISGAIGYWDKSVTVAEGGATRQKDHGPHGSGLVADWSTDASGAPVFDAIHRSLLVRFPDAAGQVAKMGSSVKKVELVFEFVDTEYYPLEYMMPAGMSFLGDLWVRKQPRWHAVAWAVRQPWKADPKLGPTFNASVNGRRYWGRFGAQSEERDRLPLRFGPTEVSHEVTRGRMDVTAAIVDASFGSSAAERWRAISDQGFLVRKWEAYDALYNHGGYEYGGAPGGRGIRVKAPRLVVTFAPGRAEPGTLVPPADVAKLPTSGAPTAVLPTDAQIADYIERFRFKQPEDMPLWQWRRLEELRHVSHRAADGAFPESRAAYLDWLEGINSMPYRQFRGHHTPLSTHRYLLYAEAMPEPVREHLRRYWEAWLMPGRPYHELQHNQWGIWTKEENSYHAQTGDWRGNHSFYRAGYTRFISTMNFNHVATMGALLGGSIIDDPHAIADGRHGLEMLLLRLWSWYDGTTQESIDHYYLGLTLLGQKSFADLGPTPLDRLMGRGILLKTMDELASCYHPALRRFTATSGRTGIAYVLTANEGPNFIMHTVSRKGALHDIHNPDRMGMPAVGHDCPPDLVARQAAIGPWLPRWMGNIVDSKPLPFEMTAAYRVWGGHRDKPIWKRCYLGRHYGLATRDVLGGNETVPVLAQWRRTAEQADNVQTIGTLLLRYGVNRTEFYDSLYHGTETSNANGSVGTQGGFTAALQHRNKAVVLASPYRDLEVHGRPQPEAVHSFQCSVALANYEVNATWRIYIDGEPMGALPVRAKQTSRITIHDGVSFVGLIPIPATDLGRTEEIVITDGGTPVKMQGGGAAAPTLVINSYNYHNPDTPFDLANADATKLAQAYGGFVIEMGDISEYASFEAFQRHLAATELEATWDDEQGVVHGRYVSAGDVLEFDFRPEYAARWGKSVPTDRCFPRRLVNGQWPYLAPGMERDSTLGQQGSTGRLEKNGAVLTFQPGRMGYLLTEPVSGNYLFANPLPDPQHMVVDVPGGVRIKADGRLGLTHLLVNPGEGRIELSYAVKEGQVGEEMADALYAFGFERRPAVLRNGEAVSDLKLVELDMTGAWRIPLSADEAARPVEDIAARYARSILEQQTTLSALTRTEVVMRNRGRGTDCLVTEPRPGAYNVWRQWPGETEFEVTVPGGVRVAADGNLALQRILVSPSEAAIEVDYAPYLQRDKEGNPITDRARALLVFGMDRAPSVVLHGKQYAGQAASTELGGERAFVIPLFGEDVKALNAGLEGRLSAAMDRLPAERVSGAPAAD